MNTMKMRTCLVIALTMMVVLTTACGNKKYCWKCQFAMGKTASLDTTVCDMTEDESKAFQEKKARELNYQYGQPETGPGSTCMKTSR